MMKNCFDQNLMSNPGIVLMDGLCNNLKLIKIYCYRTTVVCALFYHCTAENTHPIFGHDTLGVSEQV